METINLRKVKIVKVKIVGEGANKYLHFLFETGIQESTITEN